MRHTPLRPAALLAVLLLPIALAGCISLFPSSKPAQLYRFNGPTPPPTVSAPPGLAVAKAAIFFPSDVGTDRILTVNGAETAFIAGARWVEPASLMFDEALTAAFDQPGSPRLIGRGAPVSAPVTLKLDVRRFEVDYRGSATSVWVQVHATLIRNADRTVVDEKLFEDKQDAGDNRVGPIVAAFTTAVGKVIGDIRDWTTTTAGAMRPTS